MPAFFSLIRLCHNIKNAVEVTIQPSECKWLPGWKNTSPGTPGGNAVDFKPYGRDAGPPFVIPATVIPAVPLSRNPESFQALLVPGFRRGDDAGRRVFPKVNNIDAGGNPTGNPPTAIIIVSEVRFLSFLPTARYRVRTQSDARFRSLEPHMRPGWLQACVYEPSHQSEYHRP